MDLPISRLRGRLNSIVERGGEDIFTVLSRIRSAAEGERAAAAKILEELAGRFEPAQLHRVRIRARRLRYIAEVSDAIRGQASEARAVLKRLQERLGHVHDAAVLSQWMGRQATLADRRGDKEVSGEAGRHLAALLEDAGREHAAFLAEGPAAALLRAIDAFVLGRAEQAS